MAWVWRVASTAEGKCMIPFCSQQLEGGFWVIGFANMEALNITIIKWLLLPDKISLYRTAYLYLLPTAFYPTALFLCLVATASQLLARELQAACSTFLLALSHSPNSPPGFTKQHILWARPYLFYCAICSFFVACFWMPRLLMKSMRNCPSLLSLFPDQHWKDAENLMG